MKWFGQGWDLCANHVGLESIVQCCRAEVTQPALRSTPHALTIRIPCKDCIHTQTFIYMCVLAMNTHTEYNCSSRHIYLSPATNSGKRNQGKLTIPTVCFYCVEENVLVNMMIQGIPLTVMGPLTQHVQIQWLTLKNLSRIYVSNLKPCIRERICHACLGLNTHILDFRVT